MSTSQNAVNPQHYRKHQSGIECIEITRHLSFNRGNAIKYLWRLGQKDESNQELKKAIWYLNDESNHFGHAPAYHYASLSVLNAKLNKLALYQSDIERELFNFIVFGYNEHLQRAIKIIKDMLDE